MTSILDLLDYFNKKSIIMEKSLENVSFLKILPKEEEYKLYQKYIQDFKKNF